MRPRTVLKPHPAKYSFSTGLKGGLISFKKAYFRFVAHNPLLLSASTAFFTTFALAPIIIILTQLFQLVFPNDTVATKLFTKIGEIVGLKTAKDIHAIVINFLSLEKNWWITLIIGVFFYFVATTLLSAIRQCIQQVWDIRKKREEGFRYNMKERTIEISMVLLIAILFLVSLASDSLLALLGNLFHNPKHWSLRFLNAVLSILIMSFWFTTVFKVLPEAKVRWRVAFVGGIVTGLLFELGKLGLNKLLTPERVAHIFSNSGAIAQLLLFVFYCSFILYFGASFTFEYAKVKKKPIHPGKLAQEYKRKVVEEGK